MQKQTNCSPPYIWPAWLLLSHGAFIGAIIASSGISYGFLIASTLIPSVYSRGLGISWSVISICVAIWTIYAISGTWKENNRIINPTYGDEGFVMLIIIVVLLIGMDIWTIVEVAISPT
jgi:hypothetical protein